MYIAPNTDIKILKNVPLDVTYEHTIYFTSLSQQTEYFSSKCKHPFSNQSYQRVKNNRMRINKKAEDLYDCNYLMFKNTSFGNKWFYAFIKSVEYVNNEVSEIEFEIDVLQTWFFDYTLKECFVVREHTRTDEIGDNIVAENVSLGEYIYSDYKPLTTLTTDMCVCVAIVDNDKESVSGQLYDGVYGGCELWVYNSNDVNAINDKIGEYIQAIDSIVSVYMIPKMLVGEVDSGGKKLSYAQGGVSNTISCDAIDGTETFDGYKPKNMKMYTYPYNYFNLDNASGSSLSLRYEFFDNLKPVIKINGGVTQPISLIARPCSYKNVPSYNAIGGYTQLTTESITLENYPTCSWNADYYKAWLAQNSAPLIFGGLANLATIGAGAMMTSVPILGSVIGGTTMAKGVSGITNQLKSLYAPSISADICRGNTANGNTNVATGMQHFYCARVHVTKEYAMIIDDYFTKYGYAINRLKVPSRTNRGHWNYVKTNDCVIVGSVPSDDMRKICGIYDNGITFWKNGNEIGDYSLDNSALDDTPDLH